MSNTWVTSVYDKLHIGLILFLALPLVSVEPSGNNLHLCDSSPDVNVSSVDWCWLSIFFICWHVQILNILKYFKDHVFWSVMSISYFLRTRTKLGTFESLFMFFKALKFHMGIFVFCLNKFIKRFLSLLKHQ